MPDERHYLRIPAEGPTWGVIWWIMRQSDRFHFTTRDPRFYDVNGEKAGLHFIFNGSNQDSADFNPGVFNRAARAFRDAGIPGPEEVPELPRHLHRRHLKLHVVINGRRFIAAD